MTKERLMQELRGRVVVHLKYCKQMRKEGNHSAAEWHSGKAAAFSAALDLVADTAEEELEPEEATNPNQLALKFG